MKPGLTMFVVGQKECYCEEGLTALLSLFSSATSFACSRQTKFYMVDSHFTLTASLWVILRFSTPLPSSFVTSLFRLWIPRSRQPRQLSSEEVRTQFELSPLQVYEPKMCFAFHSRSLTFSKSKCISAVKASYNAIDSLAFLQSSYASGIFQRSSGSSSSSCKSTYSSSLCVWAYWLRI